MTLAQFLTFALNAAGGGAIVWGLIAFADKVAPSPIPPSLKFYGAMVLAFVVPLLAYLAEVGLGLADIGWDGAFAAVAAGYFISQGIHRYTGNQAPQA